MPRLTILFWNTNKKPLGALVGELARQVSADVVFLAESALTEAEIANHLPGYAAAVSPAGDHSKIRVIARVGLDIRPKFDDESGRLTVWSVSPAGAAEILAAATHFHANPHWTDEEQDLEVCNLAEDLRRVEDAAGHQRTFLIGDLNMSPFQKGVAGAKGLHAVMSAKIAAEGTRKVASREYPFFYNPMWSLYGDRRDGPPATYFYRKSTQVAHFWHMYDQVLVRPPLIGDIETVKIVHEVGATSLLDQAGRPNLIIGSDHLPLLFRLRFSERREGTT